MYTTYFIPSAVIVFLFSMSFFIFSTCTKDCIRGGPACLGGGFGSTLAVVAGVCLIFSSKILLQLQIHMESIKTNAMPRTSGLNIPIAF